MKGAPTILSRLGLTQEELEQKYEVAGNLRLLSAMLGVSTTTLHKYLRHKTHATKPWDAAKKEAPLNDLDYQRYQFRIDAMQSLERALLSKKTWTDVNGRVIPREALQRMYVEPPAKLSPIIPVYATLKGSATRVIFMFHPEVDWISHQPEEHSSPEETHHTSVPHS